MVWGVCYAAYISALKRASWMKNVENKHKSEQKEIKIAGKCMSGNKSPEQHRIQSYICMNVAYVVLPFF